MLHLLAMQVRDSIKSFLFRAHLHKASALADAGRMAQYPARHHRAMLLHVYVHISAYEAGMRQHMAT